MKIIIKNKDATKKVSVNGIDFDSMTEMFQLEMIMEVIDRKDLKTTFLNVLKKKILI